MPALFEIKYKGYSRVSDPIVIGGNVMKTGLTRLILFCLLLLIIGALATMVFWQPEVSQDFNAERAYQDVLFQTALGSRVPGSQAHEHVIQYFSQELQQAGWQVTFQRGERFGHTATNIIASRSAAPPQIVIGAHYDSRLRADQESEAKLRDAPVPGANDGASGAAVLLELARTLPPNIDKEIWLVFFDLEDQGHIEGWDWVLGSRIFVDQLETIPDSVIVIDMIGDRNLKIPREMNSDPELTTELWKLAAELGYGNIFLDQPGQTILDDHMPFIEQGMRAIDIIDFDYPYWHTLSDTADKVSPLSLEIVGNLLLTWLKR